MLEIKKDEIELKRLFESLYIAGLNGSLNPHKFDKWYRENVKPYIRIK